MGISKAWRELKYDTKRKGKVMRLTLKEFTRLSSMCCIYCGALPRPYRRDHKVKLNGLDRLDSSRGYVLDNVVPCCTMCNGMKSNRTPTEFLKQVQRIHKWLVLKKRRDLLKKSVNSRRKSSKATC